MLYYGIAAVIKLISVFCFIYVAFWSLQSLNLEIIFKKGNSNQIKIFYILFSIVLGYIANEFFFEIITLVRNAIFPLK